MDGAYSGATLAVLAIGIAPGAIDSQDSETKAGMEKLRAYLKGKYTSQSLFNKIWTLLAATRLNGLLTGAQRESLITEIQTSHPAVSGGLQWLRGTQRAVQVNQDAWPAWRAHSLNFNGESGGQKGEPWRRMFMSDAATAFAAMALAASN